MNGSLTASPPYPSPAERRRTGLALRDHTSQFIADTRSKAKPGITPKQLGTQPRQFGPNGTAQSGLGFTGPNGSITVVENYLVRNGTKVRRARGGSEFNAYVANFQFVQQFFDPAETWVLPWGAAQGPSGRGVSGRATVYRVGTGHKNGMERCRSAERYCAGNCGELGTELRDRQLLYGKDPKPYFFDVYEVDHTKRTFSRIVHYQRG